MRAFSVPGSLVLLLTLGLADLIATAALQAQGSIVERNPLMAPLLKGGVAPFVGVKLATLALAGVLLMRLARRDLRAVHHACLWGCAAYVGMFLTAFLAP